MQVTSKLTKVTVRKVIERARSTNSADHWRWAAEAAWALLNKPKTRRPAKGRGVWPPPVIETTFDDGRRVRMAVWQQLGQPLPTERAIAIAEGMYRDHVSPNVPEVTSCNDVAGTPREGGYIGPGFTPNAESLARLALYEQGNIGTGEGANGDEPEGWSRGVNYAGPAFDPWRSQAREYADAA